MIVSYSSFTPASNVLSFVSLFHYSTSCSTPSTLSSLSSNFCLRSSISADCSSPSYTFARNFLFSTCNCCNVMSHIVQLQFKHFSSCHLCATHVFLPFLSPGQAPKCSGSCLDNIRFVPCDESHEATLIIFQ